ncbi:protein LNK2-like isoform X2 [Bidens hawaiensis]|uniref:protein LNK2-like isoform X2 n=1 Tax=Bidens hawaiensis TaxID=980011 RepID=UPI004049F57C
MFNWEDEEITNIIWGEESENKDHIVTYSAETYGKQPNKEAANVKLIQNTTVSDNITVSGRENNTKYGSDGRVSSDEFGSLLGLSSSKAAKVDHEHTDEKAQVDNGSQIVDNQAVDRVRSNFVDYGWANVGSFDDLDRMLSNHDLELWPSNKDVIGCSENLEMLSMNSQSINLADYFETKSGVIKDEKQTNDRSGRKTQKQTMKNEVGQFRQHSKISCLSNQETESFGYTQFINACPSPRDYSMHSATTREQVSYLSDRSTPLIMTTQEKIEKLRRRQQMRALLAIRKKQQEISHQDDISNLEIESHHVQFARTSGVEVDQSVSSQSDSVGRHVLMDKIALADTVVQQFQNVIAGLSIQMRVCIRDSLFRLAQGALRRKNDGTTNKRSNDGTSVVLEGLSSTKSSTRTPDVETKTNPIDRVVARLLFHTPPRELVQSPSEATTTPTMNFFDNNNQFSCMV